MFTTMRLDVVTGNWEYNSFSTLGKVHQFLETWRCDGRAPGHLALRFIIQNEQDASVFNRMHHAIFGKQLFYNSYSGCESVLFDITRSRSPSFHMINEKPWNHKSLTNLTVYEVNTTEQTVITVLQICIRYASGESPYLYDDCSYTTAFFPVCFQCCPMVLRKGHCVQLVLQILSEALYDDVHDLRYEMTYEGMCTAWCTRHPPYAAYSPSKTIAALQVLHLIQNGKSLYGERCHKFSFDQIHESLR